MKQVLSPGTSQEETLKFVTDYMQANPDGLDGVWGGWDHAALGAVQAINESNQDDIYVTGVDALGIAADEIKKDGPFYATVLQDWSQAVDMTIEFVDSYRETGELPEENFIEFEPEIIDRSNVDSFEPKF
ncbi:sugar ABC transporter substrate-binding protein [Citricoccus nitrophenolicus]|uniref:sugar ABC transporter substrate-binding protein n=1 Tax=Citricoccus nitrophenolicus TaxID=863575 RepID=UPI0031EE5756